jgi:four helix bundle protein
MAEESPWFDHEKLNVYQDAVAFVGWLNDVLERMTKLGDVRDQLERASNSIVLNIAEGNGKFTAKDRCRFFDTSHGSALECAAALDLLVVRRRLTRVVIRPGKERLQRIVRMLIGLIKRNSERDYGKPRLPGPHASAESSSYSSS